ncbi:hypothetical protein C8R43DRAFT_614351 [Mycena crocata]|nr:hypothetical protein C8R43DRAFT_614351 [Mycena crocata]
MLAFPMLRTTTNVTDVLQPNLSVCDDSPNCRSIFGIVWGCLTTIFACTWVSVHPNIPARGQSSSRILCRRLGMMLMTVIAPEIMVFFVANQYFFARSFSKKFGVSLSHGFYFAMGGFVTRGSQTQLTRLEELDEPLLDDIRAIDSAKILDNFKQEQR